MLYYHLVLKWEIYLILKQRVFKSDYRANFLRKYQQNIPYESRIDNFSSIDKTCKHGKRLKK